MRVMLDIYLSLTDSELKASPKEIEGGVLLLYRFPPERYGSSDNPIHVYTTLVSLKVVLSCQTKSCSKI